MDLITEQKKMIEQYISEGNQDSAVKALFELIVECAKNHDFINAEALRDRLFEIAPMALSEISNSADIIEEEKSRAMDEGHLKTWSKLYSNLSAEEANALYFSMKESIINKGEVIYSIGDNDRRLCFIDSGEVKMVFKKEKDETLNILEPGDIAGEDTFFYATASRTVSLVASSKVRLRTIERNIQERWKDNFPALEQKIHEYCNKSGRVSDILEKKGMNRRGNKRVKLAGKVAVQLLKSSGEPNGKQFTGALCDISVSGLSFTFRLSNNEVAHKILGLKVKTQLVVPDHGKSVKIEQTGRIVGIGYYVLSEHSIHVRFDEPDVILQKMIH